MGDNWGVYFSIFHYCSISMDPHGLLSWHCRDCCRCLVEFETPRNRQGPCPRRCHRCSEHIHVPSGWWVDRTIKCILKIRSTGMLDRRGSFEQNSSQPTGRMRPPEQDHTPVHRHQRSGTKLDRLGFREGEGEDTTGQKGKEMLTSIKYNRAVVLVLVE